MNCNVRVRIVITKSQADISLNRLFTTNTLCLYRLSINLWLLFGSQEEEESRNKQEFRQAGYQSYFLLRLPILLPIEDTNPTFYWGYQSYFLLRLLILLPIEDTNPTSYWGYQSYFLLRLLILLAIHISSRNWRISSIVSSIFKVIYKASYA